MSYKALTEKIQQDIISNPDIRLYSDNEIRRDPAHDIPNLWRPA